MQTFLPYSDFVASAKALDSKRLGKQRVEVKQLLTAIYLNELRNNPLIAMRTGNSELGSEYGWKNHPAKLMWDESPYGLIAYGLVICLEFKHRGFDDHTYNTIEAFGDFSTDITFEQDWLAENNLLPYWLGDERLHRSHQANLKRKDPIYYREWDVPTNLEYWWPTHESN